MSEPFRFLCPFQINWLRDRASLALGEKSRRIGWTWMQALGAVLDRIDPSLPASNYYHSSTDQTASVEFIGYCDEWAQMVNAVAKHEEEREVIDDQEITSLVMRFENGRKIVAGSSNPKFFRSKGGAVGLDEYAFHANARDLYKAAHATAMFWGYPMRIWSTHNGEGSYFNAMLKMAREHKIKASVHRVTILDAVEDGIVERIIMRKHKLSDVPAPDAKARQEWLDELRATCPDEDTWNEEYMCTPSSDQSSLLTYDLIRGCEALNLSPIEDIAALPREGGGLYCGFDVGRKKDLSVLWGDEKVGDVYWNRILKRLANVTFTAQEEMLSLLLANPRVRRLCIDATGIGMMLAERLQQRFGRYRVEAVTFTAGTKSAIAMPFVRRFQDRACRIPEDPKLRESLHSVRKSVTAAGNIRLDAEHTEDGHADEFWAGCLASEASDPNKLPLPAPLARKPVGW